MTAFRVSLNGVAVAVDRVTGLALAADPARIEEIHDILGPVGWIAPPAPVRLRLERGFDGSRVFYDWRRDAVLGLDAARRLVRIETLDGLGSVAQAWELRGWPSAWRGPALDLAREGPLRERLEVLAFDLIWLAEGSG
jgi:hypothetical protein